MLRLRWFDPEPDDASTPVDWRLSSPIIATLFLNFAFWMHDGSDLWMSCSLPLYAAIVGAAALLIAALFFVGPALATQAAKRPLLSVTERSLGSIPAYGLRFACVLFLLIWIAKLIAWSGLTLMRFVVGHELSPTEAGAFAVGIIVFVSLTGAQGPRIGAKLARFTNQLGLAILIAALIRVHRGWPQALGSFPISSAYSGSFQFWQDTSQLSLYVAPLAFLAADFGYRSADRRSVAMTALAGIAGPLIGTLILTGLIGLATIQSGFYKPSI